MDFRNLITALAIGLAGCAALNDTVAGDPWLAYPGPAQPRDQVAVVKANLMNSLFSEAYVTEVDDRVVDRVGAHIEVLPGQHRLKVFVKRGAGVPGSLLWAATEKSGRESLLLDAEAGHTYLVGGKVVEGKTVSWIEDEKSQQVVAGTRP
jgi:hypothetical protein